MINKKINIGIIGLGYLGKFHYQKFNKSSLCNIKWVIDKDAKRFNQIKSSRIKKGKNYREIVNDVDAVSIITPTKSHFNIAKFFLMNKKHVLLEKPMTENISQATELIRITKKNKVILQIGHLERFNPVMEKLDKDIKSSSYSFCPVPKTTNCILSFFRIFSKAGNNISKPFCFTKRVTKPNKGKS